MTKAGIATEIAKQNCIPEDIERKLLAVLRRIEESAAFDGVCGMDFNHATSVAVLGSSVGMSERSLRDYFKAYIGQSLVKYVSSRRAEYAARIFRLFPNIPKAQAALAIGFCAPNGIYGLMRKNGVENIDSLRGIESNEKLSTLPYSLETIPDCTLFYRQIETLYKDCASVDFEADNWDIIEEYVKEKYPQAELNGYVGFAIDRYIKNDTESGTFISGILYRNALPSTKDVLGEIGWRSIQASKYAVFTHKGDYDSLSTFYENVIFTINNRQNLIPDISIPFMEKYLNSPTDTPAEELITELWVALDD